MVFLSGSNNLLKEFIVLQFWPVDKIVIDTILYYFDLIVFIALLFCHSGRVASPLCKEFCN